MTLNVLNNTDVGDPLYLGTYGSYLTSKQLSYVCHLIVERTLRHLLGFHLFTKDTNHNDIYSLDYISTFDESDAEVIFSLYVSDIYLDYALDSPSVSILPLTGKKRHVHYVNTTITSAKNSLLISNKVLLTATKK